MISKYYLHYILFHLEPLTHDQRLERLRIGGELSFSQAKALLSLLEGEDTSLENLRERFKPLLRSRFEIRDNIKTAINDINTCIEILGPLTGI